MSSAGRVASAKLNIAPSSTQCANGPLFGGSPPAFLDSATEDDLDSGAEFLANRFCANGLATDDGEDSLVRYVMESSGCEVSEQKRPFPNSIGLVPNFDHLA